MDGAMVNFQDVFESSLKRLNQDGSPFLDYFYERFMEADDRIAERFSQTDLARQRVMLRESLEEMSVFFADHLETPYLQSLVAVHGKSGRNIPSWMYDVWLDTMLIAVRESDPEWSPKIELAWRIVMAPGLVYMKHHAAS